MSSGEHYLIARGVYRTPDGKYAARYAGAGPRLLGSILDWFICFIFPYLFSGLLGSLIWNAVAGGSEEAPIGPLGWAWLIGVSACVVGYFTVFVARGRTFGMRLLNLRILDPGTGRPPSVSRALLRALMAYAVGASIYILANYAFSDPSATSHNPTGTAVAVGAFIVFLVSVWSHLWALFDPRGQTWQDHLAGVVVVTEFVEIPEDLVIFDHPNRVPTVDQPPRDPAPAAAPAPTATTARPARPERKRRRRR
ncbi:MAG: RDD family protein [Sphaerobacter sp.]|nr:RDD family protein [Sphaerobacter sp.]